MQFFEKSEGVFARIIGKISAFIFIRYIKFINESLVELMMRWDSSINQLKIIKYEQN